MIQKVKGTQDFIDLTLFNFIRNQTEKHLAEYNYTQIATPIIEHTELFLRSLGQHTDVVSKEMFIIQPKTESQELNSLKEQICLRPEATAATVRAFIENSITDLPWKVFVMGPMFRYERPQKGRFRQFHQISIEIIGAKSISQDALLIKMLDQLFKKKFLLDNYAILLNFLGCYDDRAKFNEVLKAFLKTVDDKICDTCRERKNKNPLRIFDCKNPVCKEIYKDAPKTTDVLCASCQAEWESLKTTLELIAVSYAFAPTLVRGLDYYDKTVFEFVSDNLGAQNAFCGGGRYDRLISEISENKQDHPAIGAAIGVERLILLLELIKDKLPIAHQTELNVILPLSTKQHILALLLTNELHAKGLNCDVLLEDTSVKNLMRKANKLGAKHCLILGEDEQANLEVTVKNMMTGEEKRVKQSDVAVYLKG
ncbi:MAG: histidine--tRNA ligase [Candidatus Babeliales bacterium]|nr:histidine--tRNA ligase [Candidatus Babeliales bacterium]